MADVGSPHPDPLLCKNIPPATEGSFLNELKWINSLDFIMWLPLSAGFFFFNPLGVLAKISKCQLGILCSWGKKFSDTVYDFYYMFHTVREMEF